jgi:hypothetical protein
MANAIALNEYQPTAETVFLKAEGLWILDGEDTVSHRRRIGWREDESWESFLARKRRDRADSGVLRQDAAQGKNVPSPPGGRNLGSGHPAGHDEDDEEPSAEDARRGMIARKTGKPKLASEADEEEPNAEQARKDMVQRLKTGWKVGRKDKGKPPPSETGKEATANVAAKEKEGQEALDDFDTSIHNAKSSFEARVNRPRR